MMKRLLVALLLLACSAANAQFVPGQILTAAQLNNAFANTLPIAGGILTGPLTVPSLSVTGSPIGLASGGTGATTATGATSQLQYLQGSTGSTALSVTAKFQGQSIDLLDFGADPTDTTDSTTAFSNFTVACMMLNRPCHINGGTYKISSQVVVDLVSLGSRGVYIYGDGQFASVLDMTSVTTSPAFIVQDTSGGGAAFYSEFRDFAIHTNLAGTALQLGRTSFADALNEFNFEHLWVGNNNTSTSAVGIQVNYVLNSHFNGVIAANNGHGDAWQINAAAFCIWAGGSGTYGDNGYHLTAGGAGTGAISGNTFIGIDHEVNTVNDVKVDTSNATANTWIGGTFVYNPGTSYGFAATAGSDNTILSPGTLAYPSGTPTLANFYNGSPVGVSMVNKFAQATLYGGTLNLSATTSNSRGSFFQTSGGNRWGTYATSQAESGSNAGSNYSISRYNDSGVFIDSPIGITRSSGLVNINDGLAVNGAISASTTGAMPLYGTTGTAINAPHMVTGSVALASGTATVALSGSAVFTSSSTYTCTANDATATNAVKVLLGSGTSITLTGTSTDTVAFMCAGD